MTIGALSDVSTSIAITRVDEDALVADVLAGLAEAAAVFGADGKLRAANAAAQTFMAIDPLAPLSSQPAIVVLADFADDVVPVLRDALAAPQTFERTLLLNHADRWYDVRVVRLNARFVLVTRCDVTEREHTRESLERTEREWSAAFALIPSAVRIADLRGRFVRMNVAASDAYEAPPPAVLRELWERDQPRRAFDDAPLAFTEHPGMRALAGNTIRRDLLRVNRVGFAESRTIEVYAAPIVDEQGAVTGVVLVDRDVTEAQRTAQAASHDDATARDRRLAAIGQLAAGVMHDVNNALNPIMAAAYLLRHHAESPDAVRDYADRIKKAAETGAATASRVGRFIRQEPMHAGGDEALNLSALAEEVLELTEPMRHRHPGSGFEIVVVRDYHDGVDARGLPGEIREALLNLISNAMDAMPKGGTLTVRTQVVGDMAEVVIADTGTGMSVEVQERAFEPFFSTKGAGGSGLGLAEVYGIARRHRGSVGIVSTPDVGTTVTIRLPLERIEPVEAEPEGPRPPTEPMHILIVEDHEDGREFLRRLLRADGHSVDAAGTCGEARERLASQVSSAYHLMLTDVGLPDGSGWDLVAFARERLPSLRVGVITGWEPMVSSQDAVGAEFVLRKPIRAAELLAHIAGRKSPALPE